VAKCEKPFPILDLGIYRMIVPRGFFLLKVLMILEKLGHVTRPSLELRYPASRAPHEPVFDSIGFLVANGALGLDVRTYLKGLLMSLENSGQTLVMR
jgi:hypothetical protein